MKARFYGIVLFMFYFKGEHFMNHDQDNLDDVVEVQSAAQTDIVGWGAGGCMSGNYGFSNEA